MTTLKSLKILSATHFAYVTTKTTSDTSIVGAGAGPYTLTDSVYTEILEQASFARVRGKIYDFTYHVDGDLWTMIGDLEEFNVSIEEVWRRTE